MKAEIKCLHTEVWPVGRFKANPANPNRHPDEQIKRLAKILLSTGWRNAIVVSSRSGLIVKGHGRLQAALAAGLEEAPVEIQEYASEAAEMADLIADNRISELSETDQFAAHGVLEELNATSPEMLTAAGFSDEEFKKMTEDIMAGLEAPPVRLPTARESSTSLSDTAFKAGPIRFAIKRDEFLNWQKDLRGKVGFEKRTILTEIRRRLGFPDVAIK